MRPVAFKLLRFRTPRSSKILLRSPGSKADNSGAALVEAARGPWVLDAEGDLERRLLSVLMVSDSRLVK